MLEIYTDGAYSQSRNKGGYAFIVYKDSELFKIYFKPIENATNQRAEMMAVISVFRYMIKTGINEKVTILTDSMYVIGTTVNNWKINANKDLWAIYFKLYDQVRHLIDFKHVKGHVGIEGNEMADAFSVIAGSTLIT